MAAGDGVGAGLPGLSCAARSMTPIRPRRSEFEARSIEVVTEGLEVEAADPHLVCHGRQLTRPHAYAQAEEAGDADGAMDAQTRPQLLAKPR